MTKQEGVKETGMKTWDELREVEVEVEYDNVLLSEALQLLGCHS